MSKYKFADIVLPVPLPKLFTYYIPGFVEKLEPGMRVVVSFGKKKLLSGVVCELHNLEPQGYKVKPIIELLDEAPVVTLNQLWLWSWISEYYQCTYGEVYKAALPAGLKLESEARVTLADSFNCNIELSQKEMSIINCFDNSNKALTVDEINRSANLSSSYNIIKTLVSKGVLLVNEKLRRAVKPKEAIFYYLNSDYYLQDKLQNLFGELEKAPKQLELLMDFISKAGGFNCVIKGETVARDKLKDKGTALNTLVKKEILIKELRRVKSLTDSAPFHTDLEEKKELSNAQNIALQKIRDNFLNKKSVLLHGVTSSGKTEIYIHLIEEQLAKGFQVLYLLPEIALTTQITSRLKAHFGNLLGIYHSKFNDRERIDVWNNLLNNEGYKIIIGVRSSLFLPFSNLGLIIVDEEHEPSFKQFDPAPRYNARDVALVLGKRFGADILLGTATPSVESYYNALTGKFSKVELTTRFEGIQLPRIEVVNLREAYRKKQMNSHFSPLLLQYMKKAVEEGEQVILFQNRRGFSPYLECRLCAWVAGCKHCDVSLTFHKNVNQLVCHYCGYTVNLLNSCQACGSPLVELKGFGTQKVEEEIQELFPGIGVARLDYDTTRSKSGYEKILGSFESGETQILVGTQMVSKGLDFDRVSIVGILNADAMFNKPDFRAFERSYQMIAQVSGRAGRKYKQGIVVLQTSDPEHPVIHYVVNDNPDSFYRIQLAERKEFKYPPFYRLINIIIKHKREDVARNASNKLTALLSKVFGDRVLGPQEPPVNRVQDFHLQRVLIKIERRASAVKSKDYINNCIKEVLIVEQYKYVNIQIDVDPL
ncbi:primosomal protein N' [Marinilabiliaceae bacterium ANBcel2]|nr:primosomal protein N' [Marinilabiliaceae bacterium ANBcel2]